MRYDTRQDYEGRPRMDVEDAPTEASDVEEVEPAAPASPAAPVAEEETGALWPPDVVQDLQLRWREVQWRFVDDPRAAAEEAQALVTEALDRFSAAVTSRKGELDGWRDTDGADTERIRMVVRRYRDLLDRLLGV